MLKNQPKKKTFVFLFMLLVAGVTAANVRILADKDPFCNEYNADGTCFKCSYKYYMDMDTKLCTQVSDYCATWDEKTGLCLTCFPSYGYPVKGVCSSTPVAQVGVGAGTGECDPNCQCHDDYRQCNKCYKGYKLDANYNCVEIIVVAPPQPPVIDKCAKYTYGDQKGKYFTKWFKSCKTVCVACVDGYYLNKDNQCVALPNYCKAADVYGKCTECA